MPDEAGPASPRVAGTSGSRLGPYRGGYALVWLSRLCPCQGWAAGLAAILFEDAWLFVTILPKWHGLPDRALVRLLVARETIERYIGRRSGLLGLAIAGLIGMLFPAGPFTIFPLAVVLLASGADRGAAIAFISAWLLVGINRAIIWEMHFFGTDFVLFRFLLSMPMPILLA